MDNILHQLGCLPSTKELSGLFTITITLYHLGVCVSQQLRHNFPIQLFRSESFKGSLMSKRFATPPSISSPFRNHKGTFTLEVTTPLRQATTLRLIHIDLHQGTKGSTLEALPTAGTLLTRDLTLFTSSLQVRCARMSLKKLAQKEWMSGSFVGGWLLCCSATLGSCRKIDG